MAEESPPFGDDVRDEIVSLLRQDGLELYHMSWKVTRHRGFLTLTIQRQGGVTLDDCEHASRLVGDLLDARNVPASPYSLEVESPGLDRPLWTPAQCRGAVGKRVTVALVAKVEGTAKLRGLLESVDDDELTVLDEDRKRRYTVHFGDVKLARLVPEL